MGSVTWLATALPGTGVAEAVQHFGFAIVPRDTDHSPAPLRQLVNYHDLRHWLGVAAWGQAETMLPRKQHLLRYERRVAHLLGDAFNPVSPARATHSTPHD
jgi:hypothetical protein